MLPDVEAQNRGAIWINKRRSSIVGVPDCQFAVVGLDKPRPSRAEVCQSCLGESCSEFVKRTKLSLDDLFRLAGWIASTIATHPVPIEAMVPDLRCVIKHATFGIFDQEVEGFVCPLVIAFKLLAELVVVSAVMLTVMVLEGLLGEVWLKCISGIGEHWLGEFIFCFGFFHFLFLLFTVDNF